MNTHPYNPHEYQNPPQTYIYATPNRIHPTIQNSSLPTYYSPHNALPPVTGGSQGYHYPQAQSLQHEFAMGSSPSLAGMLLSSHSDLTSWLNVLEGITQYRPNTISASMQQPQYRLSHTPPNHSTGFGTNSSSQIAHYPVPNHFFPSDQQTRPLYNVEQYSPHGSTALWQRIPLPQPRSSSIERFGHPQMTSRHLSQPQTSSPPISIIPPSFTPPTFGSQSYVGTSRAPPRTTLPPPRSTRHNAQDHQQFAASQPLRYPAETAPPARTQPEASLVTPPAPDSTSNTSITNYMWMRVDNQKLKSDLAVPGRKGGYVQPKYIVDPPLAVAPSTQASGSRVSTPMVPVVSQPVPGASGPQVRVPPVAAAAQCRVPPAGLMTPAPTPPSVSAPTRGFVCQKRGRTEDEEDELALASKRFRPDGPVHPSTSSKPKPVRKPNVVKRPGLFARNTRQVRLNTRIEITTLLGLLTPTQDNDSHVVVINGCHLSIDGVVSLLRSARTFAWSPFGGQVHALTKASPKRWCAIEVFDTFFFSGLGPYLGHVALYSRRNKQTGRVGFFAEWPVWLEWSDGGNEIPMFDTIGDPPLPDSEWEERIDVVGYDEPVDLAEDGTTSIRVQVQEAQPLVGVVSEAPETEYDHDESGSIQGGIPDAFADDQLVLAPSSATGPLELEPSLTPALSYRGIEGESDSPLSAAATIAPSPQGGTSPASALSPITESTTSTVAPTPQAEALSEHPDGWQDAHINGFCKLFDEGEMEEWQKEGLLARLNATLDAVDAAEDDNFQELLKSCTTGIVDETSDEQDVKPACGSGRD
ncbi:hypothetical protein V5O48_015941 [Marasmius crinis-equi]|uniref:Uncharacterized protein n=1 Tax=Marasmius crinis-equi TaxID=585013 RepID=A0ABR3ET39_9AGAR